MRKPEAARPSFLSSAVAPPTPLPFMNGMPKAITAAADAYAEHERTKQVVAQADRDKTIAIEQTRCVMANIDLRRTELLVRDAAHARDHEYRMAELQLRSDENAVARAERLWRAEKVIGEVTELLSEPQGRRLK